MKPWLKAENALATEALDQELVCGVCGSQFRAGDGFTVPRWWSPAWQELKFRHIIACSLLCVLKWSDPEWMVHFHGYHEGERR